MRLATLKDGSRDGRLHVVSNDWRALPAPVATLQAALDNWALAAPQLQALSDSLALDKTAGQPLSEAQCHAPLPRAFQWADGSAYVNHVELVRRARGAEMPPSFWTDPLIYQGGSDSFLAPHSPIEMSDEAWGIDFEAEVAVITDDVPMGATPNVAAQAIRFVLLVNDVSLRALIPAELAKGFGFFQSKPSSAFSPLALTPDELGSAWDGGRLHLPLLVTLNGEAFGRPNAGVDMTFDFPTLIAHAAKTRPLAAGCIIGSGTVSNRDADGGPGLPISEGGLGYACLAELRTVEQLRHGKATTPFLRFGDEVRIEMKDQRGQSLFGSIQQKVKRYTLGQQKGESHE